MIYVYCYDIDLSFYYTLPPHGFRQCFCKYKFIVLVEVALFYSGMQVLCISVSEHIWVGGCGPRGVGELPAGGISASLGTFSSLYCYTHLGMS